MNPEDKLPPLKSITNKLSVEVDLNESQNERLVQLESEFFQARKRNGLVEPRRRHGDTSSFFTLKKDKSGRLWTEFIEFLQQIEKQQSNDLSEEELKLLTLEQRSSGVDSSEFYAYVFYFKITLQSVAREKEQMSKQIRILDSQREMKQRELSKAKEEIRKLESRYSSISEELHKLEQSKHELDKRNEGIAIIQKQIAVETKLQEQMTQEKVNMEESLDSINAEISTQNMVKRVLEQKLEQIGDERLQRMMLKNRLMEEAEAEKEEFRKQLERLMSERSAQTELWNKAKQKLGHLKSDNGTLEKQLEKAKNQLKLLIQEIDQLEAKAAKEMKAERKAKENAKDYKKKFPTGLVTIVFSDVQSSTAQWELYPEAMSEAMEVHNSVVREKILLTGGYEVKTEGDSFMVAFPSPVSAIWFCSFVQEGLLHAKWPPSILASLHSPMERINENQFIWRGLRVRMGAHVGNPECRYDAISGHMDYFGGMVNRTARVAGIAKGGQVFISGKLWELVKSEVSDNLSWMELGEHNLKGLKSPEKIIQVLPKSLGGRSFPPLVSSPGAHVEETEDIKFEEYQDDEESADKGTASAGTTQRLRAIVSEIDATLTAQQEVQQIKELSKTVKDLKEQIKSSSELLDQTRAEEELLRYQVEKLEKKNKSFEIDIEQTRNDLEIAGELSESFEKDSTEINTLIVAANAQMFCLLIRQNILQSQAQRVTEEIQMYERQLKESEETDYSVQAETERIQVLENILLQIKQENEYFTKQIAEMEKDLKINAFPAPPPSTPVEVDTKQTHQMETIEKDLEQALIASTQERDSLKDKISQMSVEIEQMEEHLRPVLLKRIKFLEAELDRVRVEKTDLMLQIDSFKKKQQIDLDDVHRKLEDLLNQAVKLKEVNSRFVRRLGKLTLQYDKGKSLDEHIQLITKLVNNEVRKDESNSPKRKNQLEIIRKIMQGHVIEDEQLEGVGIDKTVIIDPLNQEFLKDKTMANLIQAAIGSSTSGTETGERQFLVLKRKTDGGQVIPLVTPRKMNTDEALSARTSASRPSTTQTLGTNLALPK